MAYYARVKTEAPGNLKFHHLGDLLGINPKWAFGLAVSIWCLCWEFEFIDGRMKRFTAKTLARKLDWDGDPEKLVAALLEAGVIEKDRDGTLIAHDFDKEQEAGIKIMLRNRGRDKGPKPPEPQVATGAEGDSTGVKLLLDRMRENHITGTPQQKREHAQAWYSSGRAQQAEALIMGEGKGKGIFWLEKVMDGKAAQPSSSTEDILKKWAREGDARDAAAQKGMKKA